MSSQDLESEVREFYNSVSLSEDRMAALLDASDFATQATRWKRTAIASSVGMAAMALLAFGLYMNRPADVRPQVADTKGIIPTAVIEVPESDVAEVAPLDASGNTKYRLVAFRSHGEGCPRCKATGQVYAELTTLLRDEPIVLEQFDLSRIEKREEIDQRIRELRLTSFIDGRIETAFLALVNSDGSSVQEFKPSMTADRIAQRVRDIMRK